MTRFAWNSSPLQNLLSGLLMRDVITKKLSKSSQTCSQTSYPLGANDESTPMPPSTVLNLRTLRRQSTADYLHSRRNFSTV